MKLLLIGNPENRRVTGFAEAWKAVSGRDAAVLAWRDALRTPEMLESRLEGVDVLRLESPGEDAEVDRLLLEHGAGQAEFEKTGERVTEDEVRRLKTEPGRIRLQRQWFLGWERVLNEIRSVVDGRELSMPGDPMTIRGLFDKHWCRGWCEMGDVPVPELVDVLPDGFDAVVEAMDRARCHRVFLKPRHGSSASGVVALRKRGDEVIGTAAMERQGDAFYNTLRVRDFRTGTGLREVVDCVCRQEAVVERWFPKCGFGGATVDLRVVTIGGEPTHWVMRSSRGPLTNLHLGNRRGDVAAFREAMGGHWEEAMEVCRRAAAAFPKMLTLGVDLMVAPSLRRFAVAEVNAFGDLLPGIVDARGRSTYERQVAEMMGMG